MATATERPPAIPAKAKAAVGVSAWTNVPATAAPTAAPVEDEVTSHENASVCVPAGAKRSIMA
jgi:hypothetical protein